MATTKTPSPRKRKRATASDRMEKASPSAEKLRKLAKRLRPPQSWYDETVNPFEPESK